MATDRYDLYITSCWLEHSYGYAYYDFYYFGNMSQIKRLIKKCLKVRQKLGTRENLKI